MSDTPPDAGAPQSGAPDPQNPAGGLQIRVLAQFVRDLSFENPHAPDSLRLPSQPQIDLSVEMNARGRPDGLFEVDLKLGATASRDPAEGQTLPQVAFQVELLYGGLFEVSGVPEEHLEAVLLAECPRFMFPFARRIIADCTTEGGFAPFLLEPIDFAAVYQAQRAQRDRAGLGAPTLGNA
jgi:preprotein translocase subunit SecB